MIPIGAPASVGTSATSAVSTMPMTTPMITAPTRASTRDGRVLALDEGVGALADRVATSCIAGVPLSRDRTSRAR